MHTTVATIASDSMINSSTPPTLPPTITITGLSAVPVGTLVLVMVGDDVLTIVCDKMPDDLGKVVSARYM